MTHVENMREVFVIGSVLEKTSLGFSKILSSCSESDLEVDH
jgi:hypothetical protein